MFVRLVLFGLCCCRLVGVFGDSSAVKSVPVTEGDSVTLRADTELLADDLIMWNFKTNGPLLAKFNRATNNISIYNDVLNGRFRNRLKVDVQTGSLTITNTRNTDSEVYQITISSKTRSTHIFNVSVYARLPVPVIISESPQNSSVSKCSLVCSSVVNVSPVTLSWFKGNSLLSSISVSDLNRNLSLNLECLDDSYSCVLNNSISNQTQYVNNTELCQPCSDCAFCCHASEAIARLVASVLVGVAIVFVVVYDITTSRKDKLDRHLQVH
ncbi:CD48 antigen-like [Pseudorasbora parva]|uniref:CD48 antigen-like n=1 Tax=Pseudorasbora parva TaxID=51549 RepID=UPI00351EBFFB